MPIQYALTPEEIAAAQGAFPQGGMSAAPPPPDQSQLMSVQPPAPPPSMYDDASKAFAAPPQGPGLPGTPPKPYLLNDETLAKASGAFVKAPPPVTPQQAVDGFMAPAPPVAKPTVASGMGKLASKVQADKQALMGTYDAQKAGKAAEGEAIQAKGQGLESMHAAEAKRIDDLTRIQYDQQREQQEIHHKYLADTNDMIQKVSAEKIDPNAFFHDSKGELSFTVALGALFMGASGALASQDGRNHGLEALNAMIDRDIAAQEKNISNQRATIGQRQSVYADMRAELGDKVLADDKFRLGALEAAKNRLLAFSAGSDSKIDARRTEQGVAAIEQEQDTVKLRFDQNALQAAQQQAAATGAARAHQAQQQFENVIKAREMGIHEQDAQTRRLEAEGKRAAPDKEQVKLNESATETTHQFDAMAKDPVLDQLGLLPSIAGDTRLSQSVMPESAAVRKRVETLNTRMLQAVGKVAKDADGKPNIAMIERLESRFSIHPSDTKDMALEKLRGAQEVVNALARQQGAVTAPDPDAATKLGFVPVKR